jgi:peptidoglycan/LPS O-acetylase OafA/YrhL
MLGFVEKTATMSLQSEATAENAKHSALIPGLELIRGLASLEVFFSHLFLMFTFNHLATWVRPSWVEAGVTYGSEAVIIFFVLSGLVIAISQRQKARDRAHFIRARLRRLVPLYLFAVLLGFVVDRLLLHHFDLWPLWGHMLMLQGFHVPEAPLFLFNMPLWSLSYEFYFYLLFALTLGTGVRQWRSLLWIAGFAAMVPFAWGWKVHDLASHMVAILACMPLWLLGTLLVRKRIYFLASLRQNLVVFSLTFIVARSFRNPEFYPPGSCMVLALLIAPLLYSLANPRPASAPAPGIGSWLIVAVLYLVAAERLLRSAPTPYIYHAVDLFWLAVPPVVAALVLLTPRRAVAEFLARLHWQPLGLLLGRLSYAIYVVHMPICALVYNKTHNPWLRITLDISLVALVSWLCEYKLHPYLCSIFDKLWPAGLVERPAAFREAQTLPSS